MYTFRHQTESANAIARRFAEATADEHMADLRRVVGNAFAAIDDLAAEGFPPAYICDALGGLIDAARDKLGEINRELDAENCQPREMDLSEETALLARAAAAWQAGKKRVPA